MAHQLDLEKKKYKHWVKAGLGLKYLKEGLVPFCDEVVKRQHNGILDKIKQTKNLSTVTCGQCIWNKLKPDHVQTGNKQCPLGQANCNCLHPSEKQSCPNDVCGAIYDHIVINHGSTRPAPCWRNTEAKRWCTDPWSIATCFINSPGYWFKTSAADIDIIGLLNLIINNQGFHNHIDGTDDFLKVLMYRNEIFQSSSMELEENTANTYIDAMIAILQDGKELKTRQYAQNAVQKLQMEIRELKTALFSQRDKYDCFMYRLDLLDRPSGWQHVFSNSTSSGFFEDDAETSLDTSEDTSEDHLTEKVIEFIREIKGSIVPETLNERDIRARLKQLVHAKQGNSMLELMDMLTDLVKRKEKQDERSEDSPNTSGMTAITPMDENQQIKKEIKSDDYEEFTHQRGVLAVTTSHENQQIKEGIIASSIYRAVEDDGKEVALQSDDYEWISFLHSGNKNDANALLGRGKFPNKSTLNEICRLYKVNSEVTCFICDAVCEYIKSKDENIVDVWAAYRVRNKNEVSFIVCLQDSKLKEEKTDIGHLNQIVDYTLIKRIVGEFSNESIDIINRSETSADADFNDETYYKLRECVARHSIDLFREHKYLSVISVCSKKSKGYGSSWELKPENCIVLYVHTKHYIPINEEPFKTHYEGIPVDVREGTFIPFGRTATDYLEHLQMGCQISGDELSGTLGCFLDHPQYGVCGLTSAHVLLNPRELKKLKDSESGSLNWPLNDMCKCVYQPASHSVGHTVQLIYKEGSEHSSGMELAVFKITSRHPKTSDFPDTSVTGSSMVSSIQYEHWRICCPTRLNPKMKHVRKFGSKTEFRNGIIEFDTMSVKALDRYPLKMKDFNITLYKQIEVRPQTSSLKFADIGDSGALVFLDGDNDSEHTCIGIVEGGTTYGTVVVTPIVPILKELNVSSLKSFEAETNLSEIHGKIESVENNLSTKMQSMHQELSTIGSAVLRIRDAVLPNPAPPQNADLNSASSNTNADVS